MTLWVDMKYIKYLPLERFEQKDQRKFSFRCPVCGDSQKSTTKKRGWATEYKNSLVIKCFNCDYSSSLLKFIKYHFPTYYPEYIKEKFENTSYTPVKQSNVDLFASEYSSLNLLQIKDLPIDHKASLYLRKRKIPESIFNEFYYSENFSLWLNTEIQKGAINYSADKDRRIVIPFYKAKNEKKIFAIQGRTIDYASPKYITFKTDKECDLIFGLDKVDFTKTVYVVEGPLDSLFLDNCLAVSGSLSDISNILKYTSKENIVIIPDNDFRNKYTDKFITRVINQGFKIVLWPKGTLFKDINDGIKSLTISDINAIIQDNIFQGLTALTRFKLRRL